MTMQPVKTLEDITETVRFAIRRLYASNPPEDVTHVAQHHAMALGMIIIWADLSFDMSEDRDTRVRLQGELESDLEKLDVEARHRIGLPH